jgi:hypothetical protein
MVVAAILRSVGGVKDVGGVGDVGGVVVVVLMSTRYVNGGAASPWRGKIHSVGSYKLPLRLESLRV